MDPLQNVPEVRESFGVCDEIVEIERHWNQEILRKSGIATTCQSMVKTILRFAQIGRHKEPSLILCEEHLDVADFVQLIKNDRPGPTQFIDGSKYGDDSGRFQADLFRRNGHTVSLLESGVICIERIDRLSMQEQNSLVATIDHLGRENPNVKLIATAAPDFDDRFNAGEIEPRLYWRVLNPTKIPPLRDRRGDIDLHVERYRNQILLQTGLTRTFPERTIGEMSNFSWPLNFAGFELTMKALILQGPENTEVAREELYIESICKAAWLGEREPILGDDYVPPKRRAFRK